MKARLRTYEQGVRDGVRNAKSVFESTALIVLSDKLMLDTKQLDDFKTWINFYFGQCIDGDLHVTDIVDAAKHEGLIECEGQINGKV